MMGQVSDESRSGSKAIVPPLGAASSKKEEDGCTKLELFSNEIPLSEIASRAHADGPLPVSVTLAFRCRHWTTPVVCAPIDVGWSGVWSVGGRWLTESGGSSGFVPLSSRWSCASGAVVVHVGDTGKTFTPSEVQGDAC